MMKQKLTNYKKGFGLQIGGFTLLELVVVMGIIGVLLSGAFFAYIQIVERSRANQALSDIQMIRQAVEQYHADTGYYPPDTGPNNDPGFLSYQQIDCNAPPAINNPCPWGYDDTIPETSPPANYRGPYLDVPSWPIETPWGGVYDYEYWPNIYITTPGNCAAMVPGIYISLRRRDFPWNPPVGFGSPPAEAEQYFRHRGYDVCAIDNGVINYLIKPL